jgi:hypothetical protein
MDKNWTIQVEDDLDEVSNEAWYKNHEPQT